tara:strand:+ start:351 stop:647 length:297 start_codon:yes stop_codon:yes gene_type:complete
MLVIGESPSLFGHVLGGGFPVLWDDTFGWDWYAIQQIALFSGLVFGFLGVIGLTEGWGFFWLFERIGEWIGMNIDTFLIVAIVSSIGLFQFMRYKGGY